MREATSRFGAALGVLSLVAAVGVMGPSPANAEPAPTGHRVVYTVTTNAPYDFELFYLTAQPPSKDAYNADAYAYVKQEKLTLTPGTPWTFETTLADPQWAIVTVSSTSRYVDPPNAHCDITIDGQVASFQDHPNSPRCQLGQW